MTDDPMTDDELLSTVLGDEAGAIDPDPDWDDVRHRAGSRPRWWLPTAAALLVAVLVAGLAVFAVGGDDDTDVIADDPDRSETTPSTTDTPTTSEPTTSEATTTTVGDPEQGAVVPGPEVGPLELPAGAPLGDDEVVATVFQRNEAGPDDIAVAVVSKDTGDTVRTLADDHTTAEGGAYGLTLTPDRRTVLYVVATSACTSRIDAVAVDGSGERLTVARDANQVAVSPDGTHVAVETGPLCEDGPDVELIPVDGGEVTRYPDLGPVDRDIGSMAFADASSLLLVTVGPQPDDDRLLRALDLSTGAIAPVELAEGAQYTALAPRDGLVTALEQLPGGAPDLVTLDDGAIVDRRSVESSTPEEVHTARLDGSGRLVSIESLQLLIDGRALRDDVGDVAT